MNILYRIIAFLDKDIRPYINNYEQSKVKGLCCLCDKKATHRHWSIMGQIPFNVCKYHYEHTYPAMGSSEEYEGIRMGLMDENGKFVDMIRR